LDIGFDDTEGNAVLEVSKNILPDYEERGRDFTEVIGYDCDLNGPREFYLASICKYIGFYSFFL